MSELLNKYLAIVKKALPEQKILPLVGLDIGINSCKMVELRKKGSTFEISNWGIEPFAGGNVKDAVQKVLGRLSTPTVSPATAVFGKGTLIRYINIPRMSLDDLKRSFAYEADKYFPFPKEQIYTDCYIPVSYTHLTLPTN